MEPSFSKVAALWKEDKRRYVKKSTYAVYSQLCNKCILPYFKDCGKPDEPAVQAFADSMLSEGYAIKTVKDTMLVLNMILRYGEKLHAWPHEDTTIHYPTDTEQTHRLCTLSPDNQQKILNYVRQNFSLKNLGLLICLQSGLRIGELCGLKWEDLDPSAGVIMVNKTVQRIFISDGELKENFLSVDTPKTPSSIRDIPMTSELRSLIRPLRKIMNPHHYMLSNDSAPVEPRAYRLYYKRLLAKLEIPQVRFHALRHSFATRCIQSKCDYKTVSAILGHSSITTTLDLYVHPGYSEKKLAIERMARSLG